MAPQDFFYYAIGAGFLVLVGFLSYAAFTLSQSLKRLTLILERVDDITKDVDDLKNSIKYALQSLMNLFLKKGGDKKSGK